jgi:hypothetical protein
VGREATVTASTTFPITSCAAVCVFEPSQQSPKTFFHTVEATLKRDAQPHAHMRNAAARRDGKVQMAKLGC